MSDRDDAYTYSTGGRGPAIFDTRSFDDVQPVELQALFNRMHVALREMPSNFFADKAFLYLRHVADVMVEAHRCEAFLAAKGTNQ